MIPVPFVVARGAASGAGRSVDAGALAQQVDHRIFAGARWPVEDDDERTLFHALIMPPAAARARSCQNPG